MKDSQIYQLVYVSSANWLYTEEDICALLAECWEGNSVLGITGMLLYKEGNIIQVLEGPQVAVCELMSAIARDPRHSAVTVVLKQWVPEREYGHWSMAYRDIQAAVLRTPDYFGAIADFADGALPPPLTRTSRLLGLFDQNIT